MFVVVRVAVDDDSVEKKNLESWCGLQEASSRQHHEKLSERANTKINSTHKHQLVQRKEKEIHFIDKLIS